MTYNFRLTSLVFLLILCTTYQIVYSQNSDSCGTISHDINISKIKSSNVIWEKIPLPEGEEILTMKVMPGNKTYIGGRYGGVYQLIQDHWESVGLSNRRVYDLEEYLNGELLAHVTNSIFIWDYVNWTEIDLPIYGTVRKTFDYFFCGGAFNDLYRSSDGCYGWDFVYDFSGAELVNGIVGTSSDSILIGYKNFVTGEGGVLLSIDSGYHFSPFGLQNHAISSMGINNNNHIYAGSLGNWDGAYPGLYKYNYQTDIWDTILIYGDISCIEFNNENHIYLGYGWESKRVDGGVIHSEDEGETWIYDTIGMDNEIVNDLQIAENGIMYAIGGYPTKKFYRTVLPVNINEKKEIVNLTTKCFPNPTNNKLTIRIVNRNLEYTPVTVFIYDINGNEIYNKIIGDNDLVNETIEIDVKDFTKGIYTYLLKSDKYFLRNKFIKQ